MTINCYFDPILKIDTIKILPGEHAVAKGKVALVTVLGSCIAACIRDAENGVSGINHFMMPGVPKNMQDDGARYGAYAMEVLINDMLKAGASRSSLRAKVFGGASMMAGMAFQIGSANAAFVRQYLSRERIPLDAADVEGPYARKIYFFQETGSVRVRYLRKLANATVGLRERDYAKTLTERPAGSFELFSE